MTQFAKEAAAYIQKKVPNFKPRVVLSLGSGLGELAQQIESSIVIPYHELSGFHVPKVAGHAGNLVLGQLHGVSVACLQGRAHYYEGLDNVAVQTMVRTMRLLGSEIWLATNASGSLRAEVGPGRLVLINDHINFQFRNALVGPNDAEFGGRFLSMDEIYNPLLRQRINTLADKLNIPLVEGVYIGVLGPAFETAAEIRAFRILGADLVGMSTIPEVTVAHHCGMQVAAIAAITNFAAGMSPVKITHEETLRGAKLAADHMRQLVGAFVASIHSV